MMVVRRLSGAVVVAAALVLLIGPSVVHPVESLAVHMQRLVCTEGATSLLLNGQTSVLYCGTKGGNLLCYHWTGSSLVFVDCWKGQDAKPFPIYSIAMRSKDNYESSQLFCGGGDRYISVWEKSKCVQKLGPHTGWVKDVLYDCGQDVVHSIGCNCIETWRSQSSHRLHSDWVHWRKRSIESSPHQGATLSSDLLCLCASSSPDFFYAGGVDGRIHLWSSNVNIPDPLASVGAHKGRVNVLVCAHKLRLVVSAGHDGILQCRSTSQDDDQLLPHEPDARLDGSFLDEEAGTADTVRWTAATFVEDSLTDATLLLGTSSGDVVQVCLQRDDGSVNFEKAHRVASLDGNPTIHALCCVPTNESMIQNVAVGHSLGLSIMSFPRTLM